MEWFGKGSGIPLQTRPVHGHCKQKPHESECSLKKTVFQLLYVLLYFYYIISINQVFCLSS